VPILAAVLLVQLVSWPLVAALCWRAARGRVSPVAWVVVVLLAAYAATTLVETTAVAWSRGLFAVMGVTVVLLFGLYPDGRFTPRWIVVPVSIEIAIQAIDIVSRFSLEAQPWWPLHLLVSLGVTLFGGQVYRYRRRSSVGEREQTRWPLLAVLVMAFAYTVWALVWVGLDVPQEREPPLAVLLSVLPGVGFAVGLLAPRGVNVDVALRWSILLGSVSVMLGTAILATTGLGRALGASAAAQAWGAAAVVAALTIPLVDVCRRAADRFVFGRRPSPLRALEDLGRQLAETADPRVVPETIVRAVTDSLAVGGARLLVGDTVQAELGAALFEEQFPITYRDEPVATLAVSPRPGETTLIARDRTVITRICAQAAPALHGAHLVNELVEARARVVIAREDERRRLRRDLHDDLAPTLAGLGLSAAVVERFSRAGDGRAADAATDLAGQLQGASRQVRDIAYNLRPPVLDDRGLVATIEETIATGGPPRVNVVAPTDRLDLSAAVEACALRIIQEAVINVRRHAAASCCEVSIIPEPDALRIEIVDDGIGFTEPRRAGIGMRSMTERASEIGGSVSFRSEAGRGTRVAVRLPVNR
jgi:signal transduction histidine kinase